MAAAAFCGVSPASEPTVTSDASSLFSGAASAAHHEFGRERSELRQILPAPLNHLPQPFRPCHLRLPADIALDGNTVEPVPGILMLPIPGHFAEIRKRHFEGFSNHLH